MTPVMPGPHGRRPGSPVRKGGVVHLPSRRLPLLPPTQYRPPTPRPAARASPRSSGGRRTPATARTPHRLARTAWAFAIIGCVPLIAAIRRLDSFRTGR